MRPEPTVFANAVALGHALAARIAGEIADAAADGRRYVLGCPGGRTPVTTYTALSRAVADRGLDVRHVVIAMMDEYVTGDPTDRAVRPVDDRLPHSCRHFGREMIVEPLSAAAGGERGIAEDHFWMPDPARPEEYDERLTRAGGIDLFILASGATDGHIALNPPWSPSDSVTRVVELAETTRRDNLATFPTFGTLERVPRFGVTVGIDTIRRQSRSAVMVMHGAHKAAAAARLYTADRYEPEWPATVLTECARAELFLDRSAADGSPPRISS